MDCAPGDRVGFGEGPLDRFSGNSRGTRPNGLTKPSKTVNSGVPTSLGIVSMVCFALIMDHCGMISILAEGSSRVFGGLYPFFAPWIGLLGAFMTGSNTNSNVVFGVLQQQTAGLAGISTALILAAQTAGGALGSMVAPAKIIVGCSTVGLAGKEGPVLKATLRYGMVITGMCPLLKVPRRWRRETQKPSPVSGKLTTTPLKSR